MRHKNTPNFFYHNLKKGDPILIIFGTHIHDTDCLEDKREDY